jgi:hypothetical protein
MSSRRGSGGVGGYGLTAAHAQSATLRILFPMLGTWRTANKDKEDLAAINQSVTSASSLRVKIRSELPSIEASSH